MVTANSSGQAASTFVRLHETFLTALQPRIERHARIVFCNIRCPDRRHECIAETVALAWKWFLRLAEVGKDATSFVSVLATLAARAVRSGRRLCGQEKARDVLSRVAQQRHGFRLERLPCSTATSYEELFAKPHGQRRHDIWEEPLQDNTQTPVPDQAAFRCDFPVWLRTLTDRDRRLVECLILVGQCHFSNWVRLGTIK